MIHFFQGRYVPHLYDPAHAAGWESYILHNLAHISWVGPVLHRYTLYSRPQRQVMIYMTYPLVICLSDVRYIVLLTPPLTPNLEAYRNTLKTVYCDDTHLARHPGRADILLQTRLETRRRSRLSEGKFHSELSPATASLGLLYRYQCREFHS